MTYDSPIWVDVADPTHPPPGAIALTAAELQPLSDAVAALDGEAGRTPDDNTWAGTNRFTGLFGIGTGSPIPQEPSVAIFRMSPTSIGPFSNHDVIGHIRQTILSGDWTPKYTVTVDASGGTALWTIGGQSATIAAAASAATVQTALQALSTVGAGNITVSGGPGNIGGSTPYVVKYAGAAWLAASGFQALTINPAGLTGGASTATLVTGNQWGGDTSFTFGENAYTVTGASSGDGNGIGTFYGSTLEADMCSDGVIGKIIGVQAEASFQGAAATGHIGSLFGLFVSAGNHKDGASPAFGTADSVTGLGVLGVQGGYSFTDAATTSGSPTVTTTTTQFSSSTAVGKVITGPGIPAHTTILAASTHSLTLSANATATAGPVTLAIAATAQATTAVTASFGAGTILIAGQIGHFGWKDETQLVIRGFGNQTSKLTKWINNGATLAEVEQTGAISACLSTTGYTVIGTDGTNAAVQFGSAGGLDLSLFRSSATLLSMTATAAFQLGHAATGSRPASPAVGAVFYDTTLSKPIFYDGAAWRDAAGTAV